MCVVPKTEWLLGESIDPCRRGRLLVPPSPRELLTLIERQGYQAAEDGHLCLTWKEADNKPGFFRIEAKIAVSEETFDWVFNGRSGYRAQYYLSPKIGERYNHEIVGRLTRVIAVAFEGARTRTPVDWTLVECSLHGHYSKIWNRDDWTSFGEPNGLLLQRWVVYWSTKPECVPMGLKAPLPNPPEVDLKGTYIAPKSGEEWVTKNKKDRSEQIFRCGWT